MAALHLWCSQVKTELFVLLLAMCVWLQDNSFKNWWKAVMRCSPPQSWISAAILAVEPLWFLWRLPSWGSCWSRFLVHRGKAAVMQLSSCGLTGKSCGFSRFLTKQWYTVTCCGSVLNQFFSRFCDFWCSAAEADKTPVGRGQLMGCYQVVTGPVYLAAEMQLRVLFGALFWPGVHRGN